MATTSNALVNHNNNYDGAGNQEKEFDDDMFRQAVIDHAVCLGMDPVKDSQFLWLAEEALLAELPSDWEAIDDEHGNQYYYNHRTKSSTWDNPLDEPYRQLFQKLKADPQSQQQHMAQRQPRAKEWGKFPGEQRIINGRALRPIREKKRAMANELGLEEKDVRGSSSEEEEEEEEQEDDGEDEESVADNQEEEDVEGKSSSGSSSGSSSSSSDAEEEEGEDDDQDGDRDASSGDESLITEDGVGDVVPPPRPPSNSDGAKVIDGSKIDFIVRHRTVKLPGDESDMQYMVSWNDGSQEWYSAVVLFSEVPDLVNDYNSKILRHASVAQNRKIDDMKSEFANKIQVLQRELDAEREKSAKLASSNSQRVGESATQQEGLASKMSELQQTNGDLEREVVDIKEQLERMKREKDRVAADRAVFESMLENVKEELNAELDSNLENRKRIVQLESDLESSRREAQKMKEDFEMRHESLVRGAASAQEAAAAAAAMAPAAQESSEKVLKSQLSKLQDELSQKNIAAVNLEERCQAAERQVSRIGNERDVVKQSLDKVKQELQDEFKSNETLRQELHAAKEKEAATERQLRSLELQLQASQQAADTRTTEEHEEQLRRLETDKDVLTKTCNQLRESLAQRENEVDKLSSEHLALRERAEGLDRANERHLAERSILEASLETIKQELTSTHSQLGRQQGQLQEIEEHRLAKEKLEQTVADLELKMRRMAKEKSEKGREEDVKTIESLQAQLRESQENLARCKQDMDQAIRAHDSKTQAINEQHVQDLEQELAEARTTVARLQKLEAQVRNQDVATVEQLSAQVKELTTRVAHEIKQRRVLHNKLVDLQGNIRVYCRVRPVLEHETKTGQDGVVVEFPHEGEVRLQQNLACRDQEDSFEFDQVFNPTSSQKQVFEQVEPLVQSALDGYNVCIFAYGQTGSGKTYTMDGSVADRGINHRTFETLFAGLGERSGKTNISLSLSMLEIYNETIRDLLSEDQFDPSQIGKQPRFNEKPRRKLDVRQGEFGLHVPGLETVAIESIGDVEALVAKGIQNRTVGQHDMNEHSSRSHLVLTVNLVAESPKCTTRSKLHLIDLAGSERLDKTNVSSGERLKEAQAINKSLSALGNVIQALGKGKKEHVPFRNSKLTYLLQDSLSGSSKVLMFVNVSPVEYNAAETLCSLTFASRCAKVKLGVAKKQSESAQVAELRRQLEKLRNR